jgi:hypothetical protein
MNLGDIVARADRADRYLMVLSNARFITNFGHALVTPVFVLPEGAMPEENALYIMEPFPAYLTPRRLWSVPVSALGQALGSTIDDEGLSILCDIFTDALQPA